MEETIDVNMQPDVLTETAIDLSPPLGGKPGQLIVVVGCFGVAAVDVYAARRLCCTELGAGPTSAWMPPPTISRWQRGRQS